MIVVDVNAIVYLWLPGEQTEYARKVLVRDPDWAAPYLWRSEFRNILVGYLRRGDLNSEEAARCIRGAEAQLSGHEYLIPSGLVMEKVAGSQCSAYDCEYVALAEDLNATLVTADEKVLRTFPKLAVSLAAFAAGRSFD